jgi:hypothetical protein
MFRAGLYARVSTNDQQTLSMQSRAMREYGGSGLRLRFIAVLGMVSFAVAVSGIRQSPQLSLSNLYIYLLRGRIFLHTSGLS